MTIPTATKIKQSEHLIPPELAQKKIRVTVVGCGGTGSTIAAGLPYLHQAMLVWAHPHGLDVVLVDGDRIARTNCVRQLFSESEIGLYKANVLATRINLFWGLSWRGVSEFLDENWREDTDLLVGCVDSRKVRNTMIHSAAMRIAITGSISGTMQTAASLCSASPKKEEIKRRDSRLPTVIDLFPEIINPRLDRKDRLPSCSAVEALERQEPFINQTLAYHALAMLSRLFRYGRLSYHGGFINLVTGRMTSLSV